MFATEYGYAANSETASVVMPEVNYEGPGNPQLLIQYALPHANQYDWASFPTNYAPPGSAKWSETLSRGRNPVWTAVGINHDRHDRNDFFTFVAGAFIALAAAAFVAAVQEALGTRARLRT
ncbi:MAG TPA: hypothetical protein VLJ80_08335 [Solirubrobacteraceae bacterium]|nr:hypothetical protein [Solirubrobacteraceae bacterium]